MCIRDSKYATAANHPGTCAVDHGLTKIQPLGVRATLTLVVLVMRISSEAVYSRAFRFLTRIHLFCFKNQTLPLTSCPSDFLISLNAMQSRKYNVCSYWALTLNHHKVHLYNNNKINKGQTNLAKGDIARWVHLMCTPFWGRGRGCRRAQRCWFPIGSLSTVTIGISLTIRPQFAIKCLRRSNQQGMGHLGQNLGMKGRAM